MSVLNWDHAIKAKIVQLKVKIVQIANKFPTLAHSLLIIEMIGVNMLSGPSYVSIMTFNCMSVREWFIKVFFKY